MARAFGNEPGSRAFTGGDQVAMASQSNSGPASVSMLSPRATNILRNSLKNADSDEDLERIRKRVEKKGLDTGSIPELRE